PRCARPRWPATPSWRAPPTACSLPAPRIRTRRSPTCPRPGCPMTPSLRRKLEALAERREELERLLADPGVMGDPARFRDLSREFSQLEPVATALAAEARAREDLATAEAMRDDPELAELAQEEIAAARGRLEQLDHELALLLVPKDPRDEGNLFLEVRAGTGG